MNRFQLAFRKLLLGNAGEHLHYSAFKLAMLTGQLGLLAFLIDTGYIFFDLYFGFYHSWLVLTIAATIALVSIALNRLGHHFAAKLTLGLSTNLTIFFFASVEPLEGALSFFFIVCALGAMATLGFEQKKVAFAFVLLPMVLFVFCTVVDPGLFTRGVFTPEYAHLNRIINFFATFIASTLIFYFLLSLNYHSESVLRENEKRLHQKNEELVKVNKELDRFVYSASHDLRSPISSVRGLINVMKLSEITAETKTYVEMMDKQLVGLSQFIDDIVLYSRNTRVTVKVERIAVRELVSEVLTGLQFLPAADKVKVNLAIPDDLVLSSDRTRVRVVLANLISNAYKYSNHRSGNAAIYITTTDTPTQVEIAIRDNGTGIEAQYLPKIFDMFFQANEKSEGSGLGLYIVKETLEKIQGNIRVRSEVRKGSEFIVSLPRELREEVSNE